MKIQLFQILIISLLCSCVSRAQEYALVIHGGAGWITSERFTGDTEEIYRASLHSALQLGQNMLIEGASSVDVVEAVITQLENDSLFNAGKGSVVNARGEVECDASIMNGADKQAGAVSGIKQIKNPIQLARLVMDSSSHVMLSGNGAQEFATKRDIELIDNRELITSEMAKRHEEQMQNKKHGTVGAVALDIYGNIAAGTSTGGMFGKSFGRIGDSPIIGAGTYADNETCGVSCTGHGEYFIRYAVAYDLSAMMQYGKISLQEAAKIIVHDKLVEAGGSGGLIALDASGNIAMEFNTPGMFRGYVTPEEVYIGLFKDD